jgi:phage tail-like protein
VREVAMAGSSARNDPYGAFNFLVVIDGVEVAAFSEASGLESTVDVIEYRNGSDDTTVRKLPGLTKYTNLVLKRGFTDDRSLWEWHKTVLDGHVDRRSVSVRLLNEAREPTLRFELQNAWPCRWSGPNLDAGRSAVAIETLEICHEGIEFE